MRLPRSKSIVAFVVSLAFAATPGPALAQSAGDDQYSDPLAPAEPAPDSGAGEPPAEPDQAPAAPQPSAGAAQAQPQSGEADQPDPAVSSGELPRTGAPVLALLAVAAPMLIGGVALLRISTRGSRI